MTDIDLIRKVIRLYENENPSFISVLNLLEQKGEKIVVDHISFRTFDFPSISIDVLAVPFIEVGYQEVERYKYDIHNIKARYYEHTTDKSAPLIFFSELCTYKFSKSLQNTIKKMVDRIPIHVLCSEKIFFSLNPWDGIQNSVYEQLKLESEYAAGVYAHGFKPHHIGVRINQFEKYDSISKLCAFFKGNKISYVLKKHSQQNQIIPLIEQVTLEMQDHKKTFTEGVFYIPTPRPEFTKRNYIDNNKMFMGFLPNISVQKPEPMTLEQINQLTLEDN